MMMTAISEAAVIHVPDNYKTIQEAVSNASPGDTIIIDEGVYKENIVIDKPISIKSSKGPDASIIQAAAPGKPVFEVRNVKGAAISGFTATGSAIAGIYIDASNNVDIRDNKALDNGSGIILSSSNNNTFANNVAGPNKRYGIYLKSSNKNKLDKNNIRANMDTGIFLSSSSFNTLTGNNVSLNTWNGILLLYSHGNTLIRNKALRNRFAIILSESNDNTLTDNSTWPNIYIILPIVLIYLGIITYLIQKSLFRLIYKR